MVRDSAMFEDLTMIKDLVIVLGLGNGWELGYGKGLSIVMAIV